MALIDSAGGVGSGSKVKAVNQLLAGVHLVAAAEALAFAVRKNMNLDAVYEVVSKGAAYSYVMVDRELLLAMGCQSSSSGVPRMRQSSPPVFSAMTTFVKDLTIVLAEGKRTNTPLFLTAAAHLQFLSAAASGLGSQDDGAIAQLWKTYGIDVASASYKPVSA